MTNEIPIIKTKQFFELINNHELLIFDFFATWCVPCDMQTEEFHTNFDTIKEAYPKIELNKIDADANEDLFFSLGLKSIPTIVIVYKKRIGLMKSGFRPIQDIVEFIKDFIADTDAHPETIPQEEVSLEGIQKMIPNTPSKKKNIKKDKKKK